MSHDCCVALPGDAMGLSAVCDCGIFWSYSLFLVHAQILNVSSLWQSLFVFYLFYRGEWVPLPLVLRKVVHNWLTLETPFISLDSILLAGRWRPYIECWLGSRPVFLGIHIALRFSKGWGSQPLDKCMLYNNKPSCNGKWHFTGVSLVALKVREYDLEISRSQIADSPGHREEEPQEIYSNKTSERQSKQINQFSLPRQVIAKLERT